jgi:hypothetical protein
MVLKKERIKIINNKLFIPFILILILLMGIITLVVVISNSDEEEDGVDEENGFEDGIYNPIIDPLNFVTEVNNPYYTLTPGTSYTYQTETKDGTEKDIMIVTNKTKKILGVTTLELWDRVWLNNVLIEETLDWYVQDKEGNVWYFGEDSKEYENGVVISTEGSWEAGVDGAKPGIIMEANPKIGDSYRQEYYKEKAEDMADVLAFGESVTVPYGTFKNCLKTRDWSKADSTLNEYKYYCPDVNQVILEVEVESGQRTELISIQ